MTNTNCCKYSIKTPDDGQYVCPKHVEVFTKIKLRNSASCWPPLYEYNKTYNLLSHEQKTNKTVFYYTHNTYTAYAYSWREQSVTFVSSEHTV
jgi:hypothetical protein